MTTAFFSPLPKPLNHRNGPAGHKELAFSHNSLITDLMAKNDDREVDS